MCEHKPRLNACALLVTVATIGISGCLPVILSYDVKPGITAAEYEADATTCVEQGKEARSAAELNAVYQPGLAGAAASGFARGYQGSAAARQRVEQCMAAKGYTRHVMSAEQKEIYRNLTPEQRRHAAALLAAGGDLRSASR